jgi:hypothetical protein
VAAVNLWAIQFNPPWSTGTTTTLSGTSAWIDDVNEKEAYIFRVPKDVTITHLGINFVSRTGTPPTYRVSIQGVDTSAGNADGSIKGSGNCYATFTPPASTAWNNTFQWFQLGTSYSAVRGELLAIVMDYYSGTINTSNRSQILEYYSGQMDDVNLCPYAENYVSSWSKRNMTPVFGYKDGASPTFVGGHPSSARTSGTTLGTNGHRAALKFSLPSWFCSTAQICGLRAVINSEAAGGSCKFGLWSSGGMLQDITLDTDLLVSPATAHQLVEVHFDESTLSTLSAGTTYYLGIERVAGSTILYQHSVTTASDLLAYPMGDSWILSTYNGSTWSDTATTRPMVVPIFADITASAGGGGGLLVHPGMVGGMRA